MTQIVKATLPRGPNGEKDPNDWRDRPDIFREAIQAKPTDPLAWTKKFTLTEEEIAEIADPEWVFPNLIIRGHLIVIPAEPNAGKTTIMEWICSQISCDFRVIYVNADISGADAKEAYRRSVAGGYELLTPDMLTGKSMDDIVANLKSLNEAGGDFSDTVMVFDTLKKMTSVIHKDKAKSLYQVLRGLSAKGMTIVLLAHTNKYKDSDGKPVFEGTGDLRSDVDEMIYLIPQKNDDGSLIVSTEPDKKRGHFIPITFEISPEREVRLRDYVDTAAEAKAQDQYHKDADDIAVITDVIRQGHQKQADIVKACKGEIGKNRVVSILKRYRHDRRFPHWKEERAMANNMRLYYPLERAK
jgi:KaiC/GvpD/RAD55 family RecA-like ATPase